MKVKANSFSTTAYLMRKSETISGGHINLYDEGEIQCPDPNNAKGFITRFESPSVRRYPNDYDKRTILVSFIKSSNSRYYVIIREEHNPIWDPEELKWRICLEDFEGMGKVFSKTFDSYSKCEEWAECIIETQFDSEWDRAYRQEDNNVVKYN